MDWSDAGREYDPGRRFSAPSAPVAYPFGMAGFITDQARWALQDVFLGGRAITPPVWLYVGLSLEPANTHGLYYEPGAGCYARVAVPNDPKHFPPSELDRGVKVNARQVLFPDPVRDWGVIRSILIADAPRGGRVYFMADLVPPRFVPGGSKQWRIPPGWLEFELAPSR